MTINHFNGGPFDGHHTNVDFGESEIHIHTVNQYTNPDGNQPAGLRRGRYSVAERRAFDESIEIIQWDWTPLP